METTDTTETPGKRFTVPLDAADFDALTRRASEERIPRTAHVRRLIAADAEANPAKPDLRIAA